MQPNSRFRLLYSAVASRLEAIELKMLHQNNRKSSYLVKNSNRLIGGAFSAKRLRVEEFLEFYEISCLSIPTNNTSNRANGHIFQDRLLYKKYSMQICLTFAALPFVLENYTLNFYTRSLLYCVATLLTLLATIQICYHETNSQSKFELGVLFAWEFHDT